MRGRIILPCEHCEILDCIKEKRFETCEKLRDFQRDYPTLTIYVPTEKALKK